MDAQTCPTCGCLVGDEQIHRTWHARASSEHPVPDDPATGAAERQGTDPAPYSA